MQHNCCPFNGRVCNSPADHQVRDPGTLRPLPTDALAIPMLCLGGRLPDKQGAIITLDLSNAAAAPGGGAAADLTAWGEFHNGVAAGTPPGQILIARIWRAHILAGTIKMMLTA